MELDGSTKISVTKTEAEGVALGIENGSAQATVFAYEAKHWDALDDEFPAVGCINHSGSYLTEEANTNQAKSYFSRLRRMEDAQHHPASARYLYRFAAEAA